MPIGLLGTVIIATVIYIAVGFVLTGMVNYRELGVADPIAVALQAGGRDLDWLLKLTDVAAVVGLASTVLVTLYGQTRIFMRMSEDGMLPPAFGKVSGRTKTPQFSIVLCGIVGGIVAGLVPLSVLGELISIGTLLAFIIVSAGVLTLRRRYPDLPRPFRVPALPLVAGTAIVSSLALMATLPGDTWIRLGGLGRARALRLLPLRPRPQQGADGRDRRRHHRQARTGARGGLSVSVHLLQRAPRNSNLAALHLTFFVTAIATELCIRTQLYLTHYPQLGGHGLHIAHLLWGGLFMVVALAILLSLLGRRPRQVAALDRRHRLRLLHRRARQVHHRRQQLLLQAGGGDHLPDLHRPLPRLARLPAPPRAERGRAGAERDRADRRGEPRPLQSRIPRPGAGPAGRGAGDPPAARPAGRARRGTSTPRPTRTRPGTGACADAVAARYGHWSERRWFHRAVIAVFAFWALASIVTILGLVLSFGFADDAARAGFQEDSFSHLNFLNWATLVSTAVSTVARRRRPRAAAARRPARRLPLADPGAAGLDLRHPRLHLRRVPVRRRLRPRHRRPAADLGPADGGAGAAGAPDRRGRRRAPK